MSNFDRAGRALTFCFGGGGAKWKVSRLTVDEGPSDSLLFGEASHVPTFHFGGQTWMFRLLGTWVPLLVIYGYTDSNAPRKPQLGLEPLNHKQASPF